MGAIYAAMHKLSIEILHCTKNRRPDSRARTVIEHQPDIKAVTSDLKSEPATEEARVIQRPRGKDPSVR
jgi:hypothetical protein